MILTRERVEEGALKGCYDANGALCQEFQDKIQDFLQTGSVQNFSKIASIAVFGGLTIYELWCQRDCSAKGRAKKAFFLSEHRMVTQAGFGY